MQKKHVIFATIVALGLVLRLYGGTNSVLFTYDQARDAIYAQNILSGHLKIVGPPTDIPGFFHGPLYLYLITPFYYLSGGYPNFVLLELVLINLATLIPIFFLTQKLFKNDTISLISILLFATSFEAVSYARWISNPAPAILALALVYLGLWIVIEREKLGWILLAVGSGVAIQVQSFLLYLIPFIIFCLLVYRVKIKPKSYVIFSVVILLFLTASYALADIKFHFQGSKHLLEYLLSSLNSGSVKGPNITSYQKHISALFSANLFYNSKLASNILALVIFFTSIKLIWQKIDKKPLIFNLLIFFSGLTVFLFSKFNAQFLTIGSTVPFIVLSSYVLHKFTVISKKLGYLLIALIVALNVYTTLAKNKQGNVLFQIQDGMKFGDEMKLVKRTYDISGNDKFSINAVTAPLFVPTKWAYLYEIYAKKYHKEKPFFHGDSDPTSVGYDILSRSGEATKNEFTIVEPGLPDFWVKKAVQADDKRKPQKHTENVGIFKLIVRRD